MKKVQATPKGRYDQELKKHVSWWEHGDERFPRTSFPAGTKTKKGEMVDMHTGEVDVNETATKIVSEILNGDVPCPGCHTQPEGRRNALTELGWRSTGWGWENTEWLNPPGTYFVLDRVIDDLPDDEWRGILEKTNAQRPNSTPPKAYMVGDPGTIGMSAGGD